LIGVFLGCAWLTLNYTGVRVDTVVGFEIGTFLGLLCLAVELALVERSSQRRTGDPSEAVFASFFLRLAVVGPFTMWFGMACKSVHAEAFALSYLSTFFVYLCWLTWKVATAPSSYKPGSSATAGSSSKFPVRGRDA
jgi:hypothetical protein